MPSFYDDNYPHLTKAPIVEGLIDFRLRPQTSVTTDQLAALDALIQEKYPTRKNIRAVKAALNLGSEEHNNQISDELIGYRYESADPHYVLQVKSDGFTLSRLAPYSKWADLISEAHYLWDCYTKIIGSSTILRIAVRYINKIELPGPNVDFDEYLTAGPRVPEPLPQGLLEFMTRNIIPFDEEKALMILTQALEPLQPNTLTMPIIVDIDVFSEGSFKSDSEEIWDVLDKLRKLKNRAFFGSITQKAINLLL